MITVYGIRHASGGFGMFDRSAEGVDFPDMNSVEDYVEYVRDNAEVDPLPADSPDYEKIQDADGRIYNQNGGTVIGWMDRYTEKFTQLELVCVQ